MFFQIRFCRPICQGPLCGYKGTRMQPHQDGVVCPRCGMSNPQDAGECAQCGATLAQGYARPPANDWRRKRAILKGRMAWVQERWLLALLLWVLVGFVIHWISGLLGAGDGSWLQVLVAAGACALLIYLLYPRG